MNQLSHIVFAFALFVAIYAGIYTVTVYLSGHPLTTLLLYSVGGGLVMSVIVLTVFGMRVRGKARDRWSQKEGRSVGNTGAVLSTLFVSFFIGSMGACVIHQWVYDIQVAGNVSLFVGSMSVLIGALLPDWDIPFLGLERHRNIVFHSFLLPLVIVTPTLLRLVYMVVTSTLGQLETFVAPTELYIMAFFFIGYASHLLLDIYPSNANPWELLWRVLSPLDSAPTGLKPLGPFKVPKRHAKSWLQANASLLLLIGFSLLGLYYYYFLVVI
ncbi:MAG: hypothetical protein QXS20_02900 [Candidatus Thorarchaeota archaeon]